MSSTKCYQTCLCVCLFFSSPAQDCSKYLQCAHSRLFIRTCGPGTVFNPSILNCDWPYNVDCRPSTPSPFYPTPPPARLVTTATTRATTTARSSWRDLLFPAAQGRSSSKQTSVVDRIFDKVFTS